MTGEGKGGWMYHHFAPPLINFNRIIYGCDSYEVRVLIVGLFGFESFFQRLNVPAPIIEHRGGGNEKRGLCQKWNYPMQDQQEKILNSFATQLS